MDCVAHTPPTTTAAPHEPSVVSALTGDASTLLTLFSGGGLADEGYKAAGFQPVGAVEYDPAIAEFYIRNHGDHCHIASVADVDYRPYAGVTLLHLSPVCTRASVANSDATESGEDLMMADACCRAIREARPQFVVLENVQGYAKFESFRRILDCLRVGGYHVTYSVLNSANFGVPQTRRRLILRASRVGRVPALPQTHCQGGEGGGLFGGEHALLPWVGWYAAVEDLIPTLPESRFADWQLKRLPEWLDQSTLVDCVHRTDAPLTTRGHSEPAHTVKATDFRRPGNVARAFLLSNAKTEYSDGMRDAEEPALSVTQQHGGRLRAYLVHGTSTLDVRNGGAPSASVMATVGAKAAMPKALLVGEQKGRQVAGEGRRELQAARAEEPAFTLRAGENGGGYPRAWLEQGRVVAMTPQALARFQSVPDSYLLPDKASLACRIVGNGVPSLLAYHIGRSLLNGVAQ